MTDLRASLRAKLMAAKAVPAPPEPERTDAPPLLAPEPVKYPEPKLEPVDTSKVDVTSVPEPPVPDDAEPDITAEELREALEPEPPSTPVSVISPKKKGPRKTSKKDDEGLTAADHVMSAIHAAELDLRYDVVGALYGVLHTLKAKG